MNTATPFTGNKPARPEKGDLSVCVKCGEILKFASDLTLIKLDIDEIFEIIKESPEAYEALLELKVAIEKTKSRSQN